MVNGNYWPDFPVRANPGIGSFPDHERQVCAQSRLLTVFFK